MTILEELCESQGLIDVAPFGVAFQSSYSSWSKNNDPMFAIRDHEEEYGFHTNWDDGPWWLLDLGAEYAPEYIIIENRKKEEFFSRAQKIIISVSADGKNFTEIHSDGPLFGFEPNSAPLILPLTGEHKIRLVRVSLSGRGALHLSRIHVLAKERLSCEGRPVFLAARNDGFGERIKALLNAMALAEHFGGKFEFSWGGLDPISRENSQFHAISGIEGTFEGDFIRDHRFSGKMMSPSSMIEKLNFRYENYMEVLSNKYIVVHQDSFQRIQKEFIKTMDPAAFGRAFSKIKFSEGMEDARGLAYAFDLGGPAAALHVRSGDLILGTWRFVGRWSDKLIPLFVVIRLLRQLHEQGKRILLFGQEADLLSYLSDIVPCVNVAKIRPEHLIDAEKMALFDMTLMSRCDDIYAGASGFAGAAQQIGLGRQNSVSDKFSKNEIFNIILDGVKEYVPDSRVNPLHVSYSYWVLYKSGKTKLNRFEFLSHLDKEIEIDAENPLYLLARASEYFSDGMDLAADALIQRAYDVSRGLEFGLHAILTPQFDGFVTGGEFLRPVLDAAQRGSAAAIACVAVMNNAAGHFNEARLGAREALRADRIPFPDLMRKIAESHGP